MISRAAVASRALMLVGPPAALTLVLLVDEPSLLRRMSFLTGQLVVSLVAVATLTTLLRSIRRDATGTVRARRLATSSLLLPAAGWSLALLVLQPREHSQTYLIMFFCVAATASSLTASAAYRPFFLVLVLGMMVPLTLAIAAGWLLPEVPRGL